MDADNVQAVMDVDSLYDRDIVSNLVFCKDCGSGMVLPAGDGYEYCSNNKCESHHVKVDC